MSEPANATSFLRKKVGGVPVWAIAGVGVAVLAYVAWKIEPSSSSGDSGTDLPEDSADSGDVYDSLASTGTVIVAPSEPEVTNEVPARTNEDWLRDAVSYLTGKGVSPTDATSALQAYLNGEDLSYAQSSLADDAIKNGGSPPSIPSVGHTAPKPADAPRKNGEPPTDHVISGSADNSFAELAKLYYGRTDKDSVNLIAAANKNTTLTVGSRVHIPRYHPPKYYTVKLAREGYIAIAHKNG